MSPGEQCFRMWLLHVGVDAAADVLTGIATATERYQPGLPAAERAERVAELTARLAELRREEELAAMRIEDLDAGAVIVTRRPVAEIDCSMIWRLWCDELGRAPALARLRRLVRLADEFVVVRQRLAMQRADAMRERQYAIAAVEKWQDAVRYPGRPLEIHHPGDEAANEHLQGRSRRELAKQQERVEMLDTTIQELTERLDAAKGQQLGAFVEAMLRATGFEQAEIVGQIRGSSE